MRRSGVAVYSFVPIGVDCVPHPVLDLYFLETEFVCTGGEVRPGVQDQDLLVALHQEPPPAGG